ncbi:MAG: hypothetical protein KGZ34_07140 [Nitrosarchaeum sp.]|nr:hypothetical protein [Nitrosarchaeum sp.]
MLNFNVHSWIINSGKFRIAPPLIISAFLSAFPHIAGDNYLQWAGLQSIEMLSSLHAMIILGVGTLAYFGIVYQKEWFGGYSKSKSTKYFKIFSFAFIGLAATLIPYYFGVGNFFFGAINMMSDQQNSDPLLILMAWTVGMSFILSDMFRSLDGKSGIIFKMPPINKTPMKKYSKIEYKVKKLFKEI